MIEENEFGYKRKPKKSQWLEVVKFFNARVGRELTRPQMKEEFGSIALFHTALSHIHLFMDGGFITKVKRGLYRINMKCPEVPWRVINKYVYESQGYDSTFWMRFAVEVGKYQEETKQE